MLPEDIPGTSIPEIICNEMVKNGFHFPWSNLTALNDDQINALVGKTYWLTVLRYLFSVGSSCPFSSSNAKLCGLGIWSGNVGT